MTFYFMKLCIKRQLQYKLNFFLLAIAVTPLNLLQLVFSLIVVDRVNDLAGWNYNEIIFLYSLMFFTYSVAQVFFKQFRDMDYFIIKGELDYYFLKPYSIMYGLIFNNLNVMEVISQVIPALTLLIYGTFSVNVSWTVSKCVVLVGALIGGIIIQACLFIVIGLSSFWITRTGQLQDIYFVFRDFMNYPMKIYGREIICFFTYVLPLAFINYYPSIYILDKPEGKDSIVGLMTVPVAIILLILTWLFWKIAIKRYSGTGS